MNTDNKNSATKASELNAVLEAMLAAAPAIVPAAQQDGEADQPMTEGDKITAQNEAFDIAESMAGDLPAASQPVMGAGSWKVPAGAEHEQVAEFLFRIGWNSPCDAQWHNLRDNLPELAALLAAQEAAK